MGGVKVTAVLGDAVVMCPLPPLFQATHGAPKKKKIALPSATLAQASSHQFRAMSPSQALHFYHNCAPPCVCPAPVHP
ncbi:hypothetical protein E2C01_034217 [Portunus trituberculatus]|uniref:Uncharacterized protein n=1 Tax=Portunus trituberculatus TaxID=210409 RepID=A0A5B7F294_PORTR|nr:hypothetical protein [Portunus trituberculatus]